MMMSLDNAENTSPCTPPSTAPSTPPMRQSPGTPTRRPSRGAIFRRHSTGKLKEPAPARRRLGLSRQLLARAPESEHHRQHQESSAAMSGAEAAAGEPVASMSSDADLAMSSAADTIWLRCAGDEKYWSQIRYAHALLVNSIGSEIAMDEAVSRSESVLGPIFRDAIEAQDADRLNAVQMLAVLRELVTRCHGETASAVRARVAAAPTPLFRKRSRFVDDESDADDEEFHGQSDDEVLSGSAADAGLSLATAPVSPWLTALSQASTVTLQTGTASFRALPCIPQQEVVGMQASSSDPQALPITPDRPRRVLKGQLTVDKITPEAPKRKSLSKLANPNQEASLKDEDPSASSRKRMRLPIDQVASGVDHWRSKRSHWLGELEAVQQDDMEP